MRFVGRDGAPAPFRRPGPLPSPPRSSGVGVSPGRVSPRGVLSTGGRRPACGSAVRLCCGVETSEAGPRSKRPTPKGSSSPESCAPSAVFFSEADSAKASALRPPPAALNSPCFLDARGVLYKNTTGELLSRNSPAVHGTQNRAVFRMIFAPRLARRATSSPGRPHRRSRRGPHPSWVGSRAGTSRTSSRSSPSPGAWTALSLRSSPRRPRSSRCEE